MKRAPLGKVSQLSYQYAQDVLVKTKQTRTPENQGAEFESWPMDGCIFCPVMQPRRLILARHFCNRLWLINLPFLQLRYD